MPTSLNSGSMPKVRASSGMIGTIRRPMLGSRIRFRVRRLKAMVVEAARSDPANNSSYAASAGVRQRHRPHHAPRHDAAQLAAPLEHVLDLGRLRAGVVVRRLLQLVVGDRQLQPVAEDLQLVLGQLLGLVGDVAGLDARAQRPALDRLGQDHHRRAGVLHRRGVGGVHLAVVVAAAAQLRQVLIGQVLDQGLQARIGPEEVLADEGAIGHRQALVSRRPASRSSWPTARRPCRAPAGRPTRAPR